MSNLVKTNIEWIGYTRSNWKIGKILQFFYEGRNKNVGVKNQNLLSLSYGNIVEKDINTSEGLLPASFSTYNIVDQGDIIIRPTDLQNDKVSLRTGLVKEKGIITSAYIDLKPYEGVNSNFFHKVLHSYDVCKVFYNMGSGVRQGIGFADIANLIVFVPPLEEQKRIADFLDGKCAQIDEITKDLEEKIEKLDEYKKEVIYEAVTKGVDDEVDLVDSNVSWIGKISSKFKVTKLKFIKEKKRYAIVDGPFGSAISTSDYTDSGVPLIRITNLHGNIISTEDLVYINDNLANKLKRSEFSIGDIIIAKTGATIGKCAINNSISKGILASSCVKITVSHLFDNRYFFYFFSTNQFVDAIKLICGGSTRDTINLTPFSNLNALLPPLEEQKRIADFLDGKCAQIDEITKATRQEIETLKQYKQSLIYEYVTGKKEVPNEQD